MRTTYRVVTYITVRQPSCVTLHVGLLLFISLSPLWHGMLSQPNVIQRISNRRPAVIRACVMYCHSIVTGINSNCLLYGAALIRRLSVSGFH